MRKTSARLMAFCMLAAILTACGHAETAEITEKTAEAAETVTETQNAPITEISAAAVSEAETSDSVSDIPEEERLVIEIARSGYNAMVEKDFEAALKYINFREGYYLTNGEWASDERVIEQLTEAMGEDDNNMFVWFAAMKDMEFLGTQRLTPDELREYNDFIPTMTENGESEYGFDDAYKVFIDYPDMSLSEKELIGTEMAVHLLVVRSDGEWKLDLFVSTFKEVMDYVNELQ